MSQHIISDKGNMIARSRSNNNWRWPEATSGQRLIAFVIDQLILVGLAGLIGALVGRLVHPGLSGIATLFTGCLYYPLMHALTGQTFGKKIIGIQVVDLRGKQPSVTNIILRETIGRLFAVLAFGIGYLCIIWRKDKRGWHDLLGETHVIARKEAREIGFLHVAGSMLTLILIVTAAGFYARKFTSLPMKTIAHKLSKYGWHTEGITGNMRDGFFIGKMYLNDEKKMIEFDHINVKFQVTGHSLDVSRFDIGKAAVTIKGAPSFRLDPGGLISLIKQHADRAKRERRLEASSIPPARTTKGSTGAPMKVEIQTMNIADLLIRLPQKPAYHASRVYVSGLSLQQKGDYKIGRLWLQSNVIDLNLENASFDSATGVFQMEKEAYVLLKPALFPKYLRAPIDLRAKIDKIANSWSGKISAFRHQVTVSLESDNINLQTNSFTPATYFKTRLPVRDISLTYDMPKERSTRAFVDGHLFLKNREFQTRKSAFISSIDNKFYILIPNVKKLLHPIDSDDPPFLLGSSRGETARDVLRQIYLGKAAEFSKEQQGELRQDLHYFANLPSPFLRQPASAPRH